MFWDAFTKGQVTEADNNTEDQKPGNWPSHDGWEESCETDLCLLKGGHR